MAAHCKFMQKKTTETGAGSKDRSLETLTVDNAYHCPDSGPETLTTQIGVQTLTMQIGLQTLSDQTMQISVETFTDNVDRCRDFADNADRCRDV